MGSLILASFLSAAAVWAVDRIERMSEGPAPADHDLLRVVFLSGFFVLGIFSWCLVAGQGRQLLGLVLLPPVVAALLAGLYGLKRRGLRAAARLRAERFAREVAQCSAAAERDPANWAAHERLAELYEEAGDRQRAAAHARRVCELAPSEKHRRRLAALEGPPR